MCNSTESCAQDLSSVDEFKRVCKSTKNRPELEACFSVVDDQNAIHRGCYSEEQEICDRFSSKCLKCRDSNYCNREPVVKSSLVCYSCSAADSQCAIERSTLSMTSKCLDHFEGQSESCYDIFDQSTSQVERGCSLDVPRERLKRSSSVINYCDSHFCNAEGHAVRRCLSCTGETLNSSCHSLDATEVPQMVSECSSVLGQQEASACYTLFWNRTSVWRGCQVSLTRVHETFCRENFNQFCFFCTEDTCNRIKLWYERCYVCHQNCTRREGGGWQSVVTMSRTCENVSTDERSGCFLRVIREGEWKQGCVADMSGEEYRTCLGDEKNCQICTGGDSCNHQLKEMPGLLGVLEENARGIGEGGGGRLKWGFIVLLGIRSVMLLIQ